MAGAMGVLLFLLVNFYFNRETLESISHSHLELPKKETAIQSARPASAQKAVFDQSEQVAGKDTHHLESFPDIVTYFQEAAAQNDWRESELIGNLRHWKDVCQKAEKISGLPEEKRANSSKLIPMVPGHERLAAFCGSINGPEQEQQMLDHLEHVLETWENSGGDLPENPESPYVKLRHALERAKTPEEIERLVFPELNRQIKALNEIGIETVLVFLTEEIRKGKIAPEFNNVDFESTYMRIIYGGVSTLLLCPELGGCRGSDDLLVLRYCLNKFWQEGIACASPASLEEAVYQTTPPVIYDWMVRFYSYVQAKRAAYH